MNSQLTIAMHVMGMIAWLEREKGRSATSPELAESTGTHPVFIRGIVQKLSAADLVVGRRGRGGGTSLARPATQITLAHVFEAMREDTPLLGSHPGDISSSCVTAPIIKDYLSDMFADAEAKLIATLSEHTVEDMSRHVIGTLRKPCN